MHTAQTTGGIEALSKHIRLGPHTISAHTTITKLVLCFWIQSKKSAQL